MLAAEFIARLERYRRQAYFTTQYISSLCIYRITDA